MTLDSYNDYSEGIYRATIPAGTTGIIFNANGLETVDITEGIVDGAMWYPTGEMDGNQYRVERVASFPSQPASEPATEAPASDEYYLVGTMNGWEINNDYKLTRSASEAEVYFLQNVWLTTSDSFKIASSYGTWYPDGIDNEYKINQGGTYDIYFRPDGNGGEDWFYLCGPCRACH